MVNLLFYFLLLALVIVFMTGSIAFSGVNRTFLLLQRGLFEFSIIACDDDYEPYFDQEALKETVEDYFTVNLKRYTNNYNVTMTFFNENSQYICLSDDKCRAVHIILDAEINSLFHYRKAKDYFISTKDGRIYGE